MKPRLLDLFCGAGGAAMGYHRAGFEVVGVDITPQPNYPFEFVREDAFRYMGRFTDPEWTQMASWGSAPIDAVFAAVHASPPCQGYTLAQRIRGNSHPDLVGTTRDWLNTTGLPWVIENVKRAPLIDPVQLEGQMFPELRTHRPRWFETNWPLDVPFLRPPPPKNAKMGRRPKEGEWPQLVGNFPDVEGAREAMGTPWMTRAEMAEAIPPAYTELIGKQLLRHLCPCESDQGFLCATCAEAA